MSNPMTAREILEKLVSFPTVSRDSNLPLIDWVEAYLGDLGVTATRVYNDDGTKASLYAHVGPQVEGGVVLSGHTDVVPVDGQDWTTDPFTVTEKDGKLFGRGTCDMKGFDALALAAVPRALERGIRRPLQIALSYDEEVGCLGAPPMIDHMLTHGMARADTVIVGEPSMMKVVNGHKGVLEFDIHVRGFETHSSLLHIGVCAVMEAARILDWANTCNAENAARTPSDTAAVFVPPYTTVHAGVIEGGTASNITARDCRFPLMVRCVPDDSFDNWRRALAAKVAEVEAKMQAVNPETWIKVTETSATAGLQPEQGGAAEALARALTGDNAGHVVSYGTEAGQFQERGYSSIICGPGDIAQAHQPDEFISLAQFDAGSQFIDRLIDHLCKE